MIEGSRPRGHDSVVQNSVATPHADATSGVYEASLVPVVTVLQTDGSRFVDAVFTHLFARRRIKDGRRANR